MIPHIQLSNDLLIVAGGLIGLLLFLIAAVLAWRPNQHPMRRKKPKVAQRAAQAPVRPTHGPVQPGRWR